MKVFSKFQQKLPAEFEDAALLTIASGAITVAQQFNRVDTESNTASDDLTTINGPTTFKVLYLRPNNSTRTVVVKHNVGNIKCFGDLDITLDDNHDCVILVWDETGSVWCAMESSVGTLGALLADGTIAGTGIQEFLGLNLTDPTELTISGGAITLTQGAHTVDTEADAASDDLTTITAAKGVGDIVVLVPANDARTIVLKHGTGNIHTFNGSDVSLDTDDHWVILFRIGTRWLVLVNSAGSTNTLYSEREFDTIGDLLLGEREIMRARTNVNVHRLEVELASAPNNGIIELHVNGVLASGTTITSFSTGYGGLPFASVLFSPPVAVTAGDLISAAITDNGSYMGSGAMQGPMQVGLEWARA
jgi:hypothetical protein